MRIFADTQEPAMNQQQDKNLTRRQALAAAGVAGAATLAGIASLEHTDDATTLRAKKPWLPVVFVPHGGGPWPFVELPFGSKAELNELSEYLQSLRTLP